jgi:hypothetical protein
MFSSLRRYPGGGPGLTGVTRPMGTEHRPLSDGWAHTDPRLLERVPWLFFETAEEQEAGAATSRGEVWTATVARRSYASSANPEVPAHRRDTRWIAHVPGSLRDWLEANPAGWDRYPEMLPLCCLSPRPSERRAAVDRPRWVAQVEPASEATCSRRLRCFSHQAWSPGGRLSLPSRSPTAPSTSSRTMSEWPAWR